MADSLTMKMRRYLIHLRLIEYTHTVTKTFLHFSVLVYDSWYRLRNWILFDHVSPIKQYPSWHSVFYAAYTMSLPVFFLCFYFRCLIARIVLSTFLHNCPLWLSRWWSLKCHLNNPVVFLSKRFYNCPNWLNFTWKLWPNSWKII